MSEKLTNEDVRGFDENNYLIELRKNIKSEITFLKNAEYKRTRESSLFLTKLEEASMWLGVDMTNKGIFKPYTDEQQMN